ncbi:hypothetical protein DFH06DRAFT_1442600 [Mycena polygramma]|nr:hypothetical protein DFH06DRAFT_1442600 [Mycena polygramma]
MLVVRVYGRRRRLERAACLGGARSETMRGVQDIGRALPGSREITLARVALRVGVDVVSMLCTPIDGVKLRGGARECHRYGVRALMSSVRRARSNARLPRTGGGNVDVGGECETWTRTRTRMRVHARIPCSCRCRWCVRSPPDGVKLRDGASECESTRRLSLMYLCAECEMNYLGWGRGCGPMYTSSLTAPVASGAVRWMCFPLAVMPPQPDVYTIYSSAHQSTRARAAIPRPLRDAMVGCTYLCP